MLKNGKRENMILTLVINHMESRKICEMCSDEELIEMMKYYHEEIDE